MTVKSAFQVECVDRDTAEPYSVVVTATSGAAARELAGRQHMLAPVGSRSGGPSPIRGETVRENIGADGLTMEESLIIESIQHLRAIRESLERLTEAGARLEVPTAARPGRAAEPDFITKIAIVGGVIAFAAATVLFLSL